MCGRYDLNATAAELAERFGAALRDVSVKLNLGASGGWQARYNIAPGQFNPVVATDDAGHKVLELMQWGLVPAWSRDARVSYSTINARAETVASKPTFRKALSTQRCLVPATGFFEWAKDARAASAGQGKQPYRIVLHDESEELDEADGIFAFAGLYDIWHGPDGAELRTYTIVTTRANEAISSLHSRMPVILPANSEEAWLDPKNREVEKLVSMLQPYPGEKMAAYPVSRLVNDPAHEGRKLIEPVVPVAA